MRIILAKENANEVNVSWGGVLTDLVTAVSKRLAGKGYYALFEPKGDSGEGYTLRLPGSHTIFTLEYTPQRNSIAFWVGSDKEAAWSIETVAHNIGAVADEIINHIDATLQETLRLLVGDAPPPPVTMSSIVELLTSIFQLAEQGIKGELEKSATIFLLARKISQQPKIKVEILPDWKTLEWRFYRDEFNNAWLTIKFRVRIVDSVMEKAVIESNSIALSLSSSFNGLQCTVSVTPSFFPSEEVLVRFERPPLRKHIAEVVVKAVESFYRELGRAGLFNYRQSFGAFQSIFANTLYKKLMRALRNFVPFPERIINIGDISVNEEEGDGKGFYLQIWLIPPGSAEGLGIIIYISTLEAIYLDSHLENATITGATIYAYFGDVSTHRWAPPKQLANLIRSPYKQVGKIQLDEPVGVKDLQKAVRLGEILGVMVISFISNHAPHLISKLAEEIERLRAG